MKAPRMRRKSHYFDPDTERRLREQAKAHGVSQGAYLRALVNGRRPGSTPGSDAAAADAWWDSRKPSRRVSIFRNHATAKDDELDAHQLTIFDGEN